MIIVEKCLVIVDSDLIIQLFDIIIYQHIKASKFCNNLIKLTQFLGCDFANYDARIPVFL